MLPQGFLSVFSRARWGNLVRVQCLQMIKPMVVDFEVDTTLGDGFHYYCFFYSQIELGFSKSYLQFF